MSKDILLIFPPLTEARFFPYLSLPMLTSYLRSKNIVVTQEDLNIKISRKLASREIIIEYRNALLKNHYKKSKLALAVRTELCDFMLKNYSSIYGYIFKKEVEQRNKLLKGYELDVLRKVVEMILEGSMLKKEFQSFDDMDSEVLKFQAFMMNDLAGRILFSEINSMMVENNYQVVGISVPFYSQLFPSLIAAKLIKRICPNVKIIMGGPQIILFNDKLLNMKSMSEYVDYLGVGDGEETLLVLYKYLNKNAEYSNIPDILDTKIPIKMQNLQVSNLHISSKPIPDFDGLPVRGYMSQGIQLGVISCVGCSWGRCTFCSYGNRSRSNRSYQQKRVG